MLVAGSGHLTHQLNSGVVGTRIDKPPRAILLGDEMDDTGKRIWASLPINLELVARLDKKRELILRQNRNLEIPRESGEGNRIARKR